MSAADKLINPSFDMSVFLGNASGTNPQIELDIPKEDKDVLLSLTPQTYTGVASKIFDLL